MSLWPRVIAFKSVCSLCWIRESYRGESENSSGGHLGVQDASFKAASTKLWGLSRLLIWSQSNGYKMSPSKHVLPCAAEQNFELNPGLSWKSHWNFPLWQPSQMKSSSSSSSFCSLLGESLSDPRWPRKPTALSGVSPRLLPGSYLIGIPIGDPVGSGCFLSLSCYP